MIDTHCHLNDIAFEKDVDQVVNNFLLSGIEKVVCVGYNSIHNLKAKEIAGNYEEVYYAIGFHPDDIDTYDEQELENELKQNNKKLVAIGEIGLDYFHNNENKEKQKKGFISQIMLAKKYKLPIIIHCRDAYGDTLEILKQYAPFEYGAVMHCFSGSFEFAREILKLGVKISFTGTVTYNNAKNVQEVASSIPLGDFFFETDCPYLTPIPNRGKRNEPMFVKDVYSFVAELRNIPVAELENVVDLSAKKFFGLL